MHLFVSEGKSGERALEYIAAQDITNPILAVLRTTVRTVGLILVMSQCPFVNLSIGQHAKTF